MLEREDKRKVAVDNLPTSGSNRRPCPREPSALLSGPRLPALEHSFRDHSLWDRCLCFVVSLEFERSVQFPCILVLRYEISLFDLGMMDIRRLFPFLYLWLPVYVGGSISDWPQFGLLVVYNQW